MVRKLALFLVLNLLVSSLLALPARATPLMPAPGFDIFEIDTLPTIPSVNVPLGAPLIMKSVVINGSIEDNSSYLSYTTTYVVREPVPCTTGFNGLCINNFMNINLNTDNQDHYSWFTKIIEPSTSATTGISDSTDLASVINFYNTEHKKFISDVEAVRPKFFKELGEGTEPFVSWSTISFFFYQDGRPLNKTVYDSSSETGVCAVLRNAVTDFDTCLSVLLTSKQMQKMMNDLNVTNSILEMNALMKKSVLELFQKKTGSVQIPLPALVSSLFSLTQEDVCSP